MEHQALQVWEHQGVQPGQHQGEQVAEHQGELVMLEFSQEHVQLWDQWVQPVQQQAHNLGYNVANDKITKDNESTETDCKGAPASIISPRTSNNNL